MARPRLRPCDLNDTTQHWSRGEKGDQLVARDSGKALEAMYDWKQSDDPLTLWTNNRTLNQRWSSAPWTTPDTSGAPKGWHRMPTDSTPGFRFVDGEDFLLNAKAGDVASVEGDPTPRTYNYRFTPYPDEWEGNNGGRYRFQKKVSVHQGIMSAQVR